MAGTAKYKPGDKVKWYSHTVEIIDVSHWDGDIPIYNVKSADGSDVPEKLGGGMLYDIGARPWYADGII